MVTKSNSDIMSIIEDLKNGLAMYHLWGRLGWKDILHRYQRSFLGPLWLSISMGVLIAARSIWDLLARFLELISGKCRYRPMSVLVEPVVRAFSIVRRCHSFTSGLSLYHFSTIFCASLTLTPKSFERPCAVLPYAMLKFNTFACLLSEAYLSLRSGTCT